MKFSYNWLQSFFRKKLPGPDKLAEILTAYSFEVGKAQKKASDWVLDIDVLPNRAPDCLSHMGIAREIAAISNSKLKIENSKFNEDKNLKAKDFVSVDVKHKWACPRYTARVICDVKVAPSPKWLRARLETCGLRPVNNIVDIANYVMLETGQPLHAFDFDKIEGGNSKSEILNSKQIQNLKFKIKKLIVRFAKEGEKIVTLDEEKCDLDKNILVIADAKKPVAIAGIKGGKAPEIDLKTKVVILESANFNSRLIRRGSKRIDLKTDASWRFEHAISPNLTELAISRAAFLIQKIAQGKVAKGLIDIYSKKTLTKRIRLDLDYVEKLLGVKIPKKEKLNILQGLKFQCSENGSRYIEVEAPTFRLDISISEDLIEEIGRIYGYEKIPAQFPVASLVPPKKNLALFWEDVAKNILKEAGFTEVYNYSFISEKDASTFSFTRPDLVEVENPISAEQRYLRPSLTPNLLKNIQRNQKHFPEIKIFELGKIFKKIRNQKSKIKMTNQNSKIVEKRMLTGIIIGEAFYQAKGVIDVLLNKLCISNIWYNEYQPTPEESKISIWQPKKCAEIKVDGQEIGFLGEISLKISSDLKISQATVFDIDFEALSKLCSEEQEYRPIPCFPAAVRDLAVLVPLTTRVDEVLNEIETAGGEMLRDTDLFDIYEGEELPEGRKNLAFHLIFQAKDRTLSSKEIEGVMNKIIKTLEKNSEWQIRK